jgi:hypothetical protein
MLRWQLLDAAVQAQATGSDRDRLRMAQLSGHRLQRLDAVV